MKTKFLQLLLLLFISNLAMSQELTLQQIRDNALAEGAPLKTIIEDKIFAKVKSGGMVSVDLYMGSHYVEGMLIRRALLPLVEEYAANINFNLHYYGSVDDGGVITSRFGEEEVHEGLRQLAIKELYPKAYFSYLMLQGSDAPEDLSNRLNLDNALINERANSEQIQSIFLQSVLTSGELVENQLESKLLIDGIELKPAEVLPPPTNCYNPFYSFYDCWEPDNDLTYFAWAGLGASCYSCYVLSPNPTTTWLSYVPCYACLVGVPLFYDHFVQCWNDAMDATDDVSDPGDDIALLRGRFNCDPNNNQVCITTQVQVVKFALEGENPELLPDPNIVAAGSCVDCPDAEEQITKVDQSELRVGIEKPELDIWWLFVNPSYWVQASWVFESTLYIDEEFIETKYNILDWYSDVVDQSTNSHFLSNRYIRHGANVEVKYTGLEDAETCDVTKAQFTTACPITSLKISQSDELFVNIDFHDNTSDILSPYVVNWSATVLTPDNILEDYSGEATGASNFSLGVAEPGTEVSITYYTYHNEYGNSTGLSDESCQDTKNYTIHECDLPSNQVTVEDVHTSSATPESNYTDGSAVIFLEGQTLPYVIRIFDNEDNLIFYEEVEYNPFVVQNLSCGIYYIQTECTDGFTPFTINPEDCGNRAACSQLYISGSVTSESEDNAMDGTIDINNVAGLIYKWDDQDFWTEDPDRTHLPAGTYCVTGLDVNCCVGYACFEVEVYCDIDAYHTIEAACDGQYNGAIFVNPENGVPPYNYLWHNGNGGNALIGVPAGQYSVTIWDARDCYQNFTFEVPNMTDDMLTVLVDHQTGSLDIIYNGSVGIVRWDGPGINAGNRYNWNQTGLTEPGNYCVTIETELGCSLTECVNLNLPMEVESDVLGCYDANNGDVLFCLTTSGGNVNTGYSYVWTGDFVEAIGNCARIIPGNSYCVTVTDNDPDFPQTYTECSTIPALGVELVSSQTPCPGENNGQFCLQGTGGAEFYYYKWSDNTIASSNSCSPSNLAGGVTYTVTITDLCGGEIYYDHYLPDDYVIPYVASVDMQKACYNTWNGSLSLEIVGGSEDMTYTWTGSHQGGTTTTTEPVLENIPGGLYWVTINHQCGSEEFGFYTVEMYDNDAEDLMLNIEVTPDCKYGNSDEGAIAIIDDGSNGPLTFEWSTGATTSSISGLEADYYWVIVTLESGCQTSELIQVPSLGDFIIDENIISSCGNNNSGSIELTTVAGDYNFVWSNGGTTATITDLDIGFYTVTVTDNEFGCTQTENFYVPDGNDDPGFDYEVNVIRHFESEYSSPDAVVLITSDFFEDGGKVSLDLDPTAWAWTHSDVNDPARLVIPVELSDNIFFYFTYTSPAGCEFQGIISGIPTCTNNSTDDYHLIFTHNGNVEDVCGTHDSHSYDVEVIDIGSNAPYYLEVTMLDAHDPADQDYIAIYEYDFQLNFTIDDVPSGLVQFRTYNNCHRGDFRKLEHLNCCKELSCEILREGYDGDDQGPSDDNYYYKMDFVEIYIRDLCFDGDCSGWFEDCSEIVLDLDQGSHVPLNNCWYGEVTIDFPDGTSAIFRVDPDDDDQGVYDQVYWISENSWRPNSPGTYNITITYNGDDYQGSGSDCSRTIPVTFYGAANYGDVVGFNDDFWFPDDYYPEGSMDAYHGVWRCNRCGTNKYALHNDQGECDEYFNWMFTHFNYTPTDYDNACNSGGILTIINFDANGEAVEMTYVVPPNVALEEFPGLQAFHGPQGEWCDQSGWCHFEGNPIYGIVFDKPILATWFNPATCEEQGPTNNPCGPNNPCLTGDCVFGECVENDDCDPDCPDDHTCIEGECVLDVPTDCVDNCDCEEGFFCLNDNCVPFQDGSNCIEPCQCPPNYDCVDNVCEFVGCDGCPPFQYCDDNNCEPCPDINIDFCYGDCGNTTDCVLEIIIWSSEYIFPAQVDIYRDGSLITSFDELSISTQSNPRRLLEVVPQICEGYFEYTVVVSFDACPAETATGNFNCLTGCPGFTGDEHNSREVTEAVTVLERTIFNVFPNPFTDVLNIECEAEKDKDLNIVVTNALGAVIHNESQQVKSGPNLLKIDLNPDIPTGLLYLSIEDDDGNLEVFKVVKVNKGYRDFRNK